MTNLEEEMMAAARRIRNCHFAALQGLGIRPIAIGQLNAKQHSIGAACIDDVGGGFFQPSGDGSPACLVACCVHDDDWDCPALLDIIAFRTGDPSRWWWRSGNAALLGEDLVAYDKGEPVSVVATPAEWLAMAGNAVCILDWSPTSPAWSMMRHGPPLQFTDGLLRKRVTDALIRSAPMPNLELVA